MFKRCTDFLFLLVLSLFSTVRDLSQQHLVGVTGTGTEQTTPLTSTVKAADWFI